MQMATQKNSDRFWPVKQAAGGPTEATTEPACLSKATGGRYPHYPS